MGNAKYLEFLMIRVKLGLKVGMTPSSTSWRWSRMILPFGSILSLCILLDFASAASPEHLLAEGKKVQNYKSDRDNIENCC